MVEDEHLCKATWIVYVSKSAPQDWLFLDFPEISDLWFKPVSEFCFHLRKNNRCSLEFCKTLIGAFLAKQEEGAIVLPRSKDGNKLLLFSKQLAC